MLSFTILGETFDYISEQTCLHNGRGQEGEKFEIMYNSDDVYQYTEH